jgi:ferric-dicitrate binding protein FerR (iron transport regulator)
MNNLIDRRTMLLGMSSLTAAMTNPSRAAQPVGAVVASVGAAFLERDANRMPAEAGADVMLDDLAGTGDKSRLDLQVGRATRLKLGARARLKIDRFIIGIEADVELLKGPVLIDHQRGAEPGFTLKSPYALIAARGTSVFAGPSMGVFGVFVREGLVDVRTRTGAVVLGPGEGTDIARPGVRPTAPKRWGPPRIAAALASVS